MNQAHAAADVLEREIYGALETAAPDNWGLDDDPYFPPYSREGALYVLRTRQAPRMGMVSVPLAVLHHAADADLTATQTKALMLSLARCTSDGTAEFERGELARLLGIQTGNATRILRALERSNLVQPGATTTLVRFVEKV
ncbi:hypothetical protein [Brachybacterium hainanense]|uniref:HTH marR-type domain-containing protein n=1 Tax=Brachybacterium hainanense TaxID=1541174 RepID=A0ABV6RC85_9MICO